MSNWTPEMDNQVLDELLHADKYQNGSVSVRTEHLRAALAEIRRLRGEVERLALSKQDEAQEFREYAILAAIDALKPEEV